jgi:hypothetical protein
METQQKTSPTSDKPSFFGMPRGGRIWVEAGRRFWIGAFFGFLNGIGFGLIFGVAMVQEWKFITPENDMVVTGITMVLLITSIFWAQWAIGRNPQQSAN